MTFQIKSSILGFDDTLTLEYIPVDELFSTVKDASNPDISFPLVNPYVLREYSFEIPAATQALLELNPDSQVEVYVIAVLQNPLDESRVNFLAPLLFNRSNGTVAQVVLNPVEYPTFGMAEPLKSFLKEEG